MAGKFVDYLGELKDLGCEIRIEYGSGDYYIGFVLDVGEDYVKLEKNGRIITIPYSSIRHVENFEKKKMPMPRHVSLPSRRKKLDRSF